jgi:hypothetical protein
MQTQVLSRARPIRIAYLIELEGTSQPILDAVFSQSFAIWGGRFSLIVPCRGGAPVEAYLPWLEAFDADVIYSYVDLASEVQTSFHETYYPFGLQHHDLGREGQNPSYAPQLAISPLGASTLVPVAGAPSGLDGSRGITILSAMGSLESNPFLKDSFGFAGPGLRNGMRGVFADNGSIVLAIAEGELEPRGRYVQGSETTLPDVTSVVTAMAANKRLSAVSRLSAALAPRLDLRNTRWGASFNLVVGETIDDRLLYWNARSLMPAWMDGFDADLCIPPALFDDQAFIVALREYLNRRNFVNGGGSGLYRATLRSISLDQQTLEGLAARLRDRRCWSVIDHEHVPSIDECVPDAGDLQHSQFTVGQQGFQAPKNWIESYASSDELRLIAPEPDHLRHAPTAALDATAGAWAVDLDVERAVDHSPFSNVRHRWRLPRRLRVTSAFLASYQLSEPYGQRVKPRVTRHGLLCVYTAARASLPTINLPTDEAAIVTGLTRGRDWSPFHRQDFQQLLPQLSVEARRSSAGRHFWGVLQMFGDLNSARGFLMHEFWRQQLRAFDATSERSDARGETVGKQLLRRIGGGLDLSQEHQLQSAINIVLQTADEERTTIRTRSWSKIESDFEKFIAADSDVPGEGEQSEDEEEQKRWMRQTLPRSVQSLCERGVLYQGYEHRCRRCLHKSWIGIAALQATITCEVCSDEQPAPVNRPWDFRLNGFLREALQHKGIGPLIWTLGRFQQFNAGSFWFEGPLDIFFDVASAQARRQATDIDLTMIDGGLVKMCEAKQSERQFQRPADLAATMARLRPDVAIIAVMEPHNNAIAQKFAAFSAALNGTGIRPELLTLDPKNDFERLPYL